jgi:transcriptional antiterminator NusG
MALTNTNEYVSLGRSKQNACQGARLEGLSMTFQQLGQQFTCGAPDGAFPWFAVRVRSNYEHVAAVHLRERGYEEFSPSYKAERRWSDRKKTIDQFLFPGYVFCRLDPQDRLPVVTVPGVIALVGFGKTPSPIPDCEIDHIRTMVQSGLLVTPWPFLELGQRVLIERGPLVGVEGILEDVRGKYRLVVSISLLQRAVSAEVDRNWVRPVRQSLSKEILIRRPVPFEH